MINSHIGHMQFNVDPKNLAFYKELFGFLGWSIVHEDPNTVGVACEKGTSLWFAGCAKNVSNDYDGPGMNHLAISVSAQTNVDETVTYLQNHAIPALFDTPRHRPDFSPSPDKTYYQVMFESPDRIQLEVFYIGTKS